MNEIQKNDGYAPYQAIQYDTFSEDTQSVSPLKLLLVVAKRWRMVIGLTLLISIVILPFLWIIGKNYYETEGAIRVTPVASPILFGDVESDIQMGNFESFVNTQVSLMVSNNVLNRIADDLAGKQLKYFEGVDNYAIALKLAVKNQRILIEPVELTELVRISMKSPDPQESENIVNAFIRAYMAVTTSDVVRGGDQKLAILEEKGRVISDQMRRQRDEIRRLAEEYGTLTLGERYGMMLQQVGTLQNELTTLEIQQMAIEVNIKINEGQDNREIQPSEMIQMRYEFVNSDPAMQNLMTELAAQEALVLELRQVMADDSGRLVRQADLVASLNKSVKQREQELIAKFDVEFKDTMTRNQQYNISDLKSQLATNKEYEKRMQDRLKKANSEVIEMGRKQLTISDLQDELTRMKETYDAVNQRIDELKMERKRPAQVSIAYMASSVPAQSMKMKLTLVIVFGALCFSSMLMLLLEKLDTSLRSPEDLVSKAGVNIIGTTTNPENIDNKTLTRMLSEDYQTIRANIGLLSTDSEKKIIVVTSPGIGDGKTTFAVNIATSFAKSGKKILLIDGDLRKPDIAATLKLPEKLRGLQDLLEGAEPQKAVYSMPATGVDILAADRSNTANALDILTRPDTARTIRNLCAHYDHVIIDTPPLLGFTDAMIWAKIADGVVLTSYINRTCSSAFKMTVERLSRIDTPLIGAVVNNVQINDPYRYSGFGYGDAADFSVGWPINQEKDSTLLLATEQPEEIDT